MKAAITAIGHGIVIGCALFIWFFVFFIWVGMFGRAMYTYSWAYVRYLFDGRNPPDKAYLDHTADFWFRGFRKIPRMFSATEPIEPLLYPGAHSIWLELVVACLFYLWILSTWLLRDYLAFALVWSFSTLWYLIVSLISALFSLLRRLPTFPW